MLKILDQIDVNPIIKSYNELADKITWTLYLNKGKQVGLQFKDAEDPHDSAVGRSKGSELEYDQLNPVFDNTIFSDIIQKYNLKRTRLMWVDPYACYSMHVDSTPRIHIPLISNPECYFVFKYGMIKHLSVGNVYWINTKILHTFMNCSDTPRLHLIGVVKD